MAPRKEHGGFLRRVSFHREIAVRLRDVRGRPFLNLPDTYRDFEGSPLYWALGDLPQVLGNGLP
jgi:hypothetical protein